MSLNLRPPSAQLEQMALAAEGKSSFAPMFYKLAESYWQARDFDAYAWCFRRAYQLNPAAKFVDVPVPNISPARAADIRERARVLVAAGVAYSAVIASLTVAEAVLGNDAAVRDLMDYDRFVYQGTLDPPDGMTLDQFNAMLADEIKSDLQFFDTPSERAIRHAWRFEKIGRPSTPAVRMLKRILTRQFHDYIVRLPAEDHPFVRARADDFRFTGWAVVSDGASHHMPHIHAHAWITGVYYVVQPDVSRGSHRGWLRIGPPGLMTDRRGKEWESRLVEPKPGGFVLMPGYFWHDTEPMGVDQERICIAFEAGPPELAGEAEAEADHPAGHKTVAS